MAVRWLRHCRASSGKTICFSLSPSPSPPPATRAKHYWLTAAWSHSLFAPDAPSPAPLDPLSPRRQVELFGSPLVAPTRASHEFAAAAAADAQVAVAHTVLDDPFYIIAVQMAPGQPTPCNVQVYFESIGPRRP